MQQGKSDGLNHFKDLNQRVKARIGVWYEIFVFGLVSSVYIFFFSQHTDIMSADARLTATLSDYQLKSFSQILSLRSDYLFGLGGLQGGYLFWIDPVSVIGSIGTPVYNHVLVALFFAMAIFGLTRIFLRKFGQSEYQGLICATLTAVATIWGYSIALVDNELFGHVPQYGSLLVCSLGILGCFMQFSQKTGTQGVLWGTAFIFLVLYLFTVLPHVLVTALPLLIFVALSAMIYTAKKYEIRKLIRQMVLIVTTIVLLILLKAPVFLLGFYRNTAATETPLTAYSQPQIRPIYRFIFETYFPTPSASGNYWFQFICFVLLATYLVSGLFKSARRDMLWLASMLSASFLLGYRFWQSTWEFESGPRISYFIWMLSPLYALGITKSLTSFFVFVKKSGVFTKIRLQKPNKVIATVFAVTVIGASPLMSLVFSLGEPRTIPLSELRGNTFLESQISLQNNSLFNGRAAYLFQQPDYPASIASRIPLLNDYSHNLTPRAFAFQSKFVLDEGSSQSRLRYVYGSRNVSIYQMLGVKYLIVSTENLRRVTDSFGSSIKSLRDIESDNFVVELADTNIGNFSPTIIRVSDSLSKTFDEMSAVGFDPKIEVVLRKPLLQELVTANSSKMQVVDGDLRLIASSSGASLILLPLEFSQCLEFEPLADSVAPIDVFLANGLLTAVLFEKKIDLKIKMRFGLFENPECRLSDLNDYRSAAER